MTALAIRAEGLSKRYFLGERQRYVALRDVLTDSFTAPLRWLRRVSTSGAPRPEKDNVLWSLKDASFEIRDGEAVGIVGRNGAGKSTLLKLLARVTRPTEGRAEVRGRIGSLLEVGTGFHPELTGRENIYLNGAILGMRKAEIDAKFDEMVEFSGVARFLDTPLKHYSSGMQMRLAFSVAAHLEPEILLVDEVLAVGDLEFQKKCMGKMEEVARHGRTVLFVSHNMGAIRRLCTRAIWLDAGRVRMTGTADECVDGYSASVEAGAGSGGGEIDLTRRTDRVGTAKARFNSIRLIGADGQIRNEVDFGEPFVLEFKLTCRESVLSSFVGITILANDGASVIGSHHCDSCDVRDLQAGGTYTMRCHFAPNHLKPGTYELQAGLMDFASWEPHDWFYSAGQFTVGHGTGKFGRSPDNRPAMVQPAFRWEWQ